MAEAPASTGKQTKRPITRQKRWSQKVKTGCITCRSRRVKCDESKPVCKRCLKGNFQCHGYAPGRNSAATATELRPLVARPSLQLSSSPQLNGSSDVRDLILLIHEISTITEDHIAPFTPSKYILYRGRGVLSYVAQLPRRAGYNSTLDAALKSLSHVMRLFEMRKFTSAQPALERQCLIFYGDAIAQLKDDLADPVQCLAPETLCAVELLSFFESFFTDDPQPTLAHALGAARLIEHRGHKRFRTDFEKSLLTSQLTSISMQAFMRHEAPFLDSVEWLSVVVGAEEGHDYGAHLATDRSQACLDYFVHFMPILTFLTRCTVVLGMEDNRHKTDELEHLGAQVILKRSLLYRWADAMTVRYGGRDAHDEYWPDLEMSLIAQMILYNRLCFALGLPGRYAMEKETLQMSNRYALNHNPSPLTYQRQALVMFISALARGTVATASAWREASVHRSDGDDSQFGDPIPKAVYVRWLRAIGVQI
ncbi:hypothetical protein VHEMI03040 [[Torrubiella] hemipterigena]|uniref:Zn(2)-C6 fungal-type domain-containing protein n=1 Tax=[Torrubiella] hemipterigena TaxID=1531966 RepID=A0A0A1SXE1_9HYPO|nr:hypothetical protein VHEMI03040 [[Torrubiella] hemipterigena]